MWQRYVHFEVLRLTSRRRIVLYIDWKMQSVVVVKGRQKGVFRKGILKGWLDRYKMQ